jgi:hypothetical protein
VHTLFHYHDGPYDCPACLKREQALAEARRDTDRLITALKGMRDEAIAARPSVVTLQVLTDERDDLRRECERRERDVLVVTNQRNEWCKRAERLDKQLEQQHANAADAHDRAEQAETALAAGDALADAAVRAVGAGVFDEDDFYDYAEELFAYRQARRGEGQG